MIVELWNTKKREIITAVAVLGSILTIFTGVIFVDDRYVHAADFSEQIQYQQTQNEQLIQSIREQQLHDQLFELEFKIQSGEAKPIDKALKERYLQQLQQLR